MSAHSEAEVHKLRKQNLSVYQQSLCDLEGTSSPGLKQKAERCVAREETESSARCTALSMALARCMQVRYHSPSAEAEEMFEDLVLQEKKALVWQSRRADLARRWRHREKVIIAPRDA